MSTFVSGPVRVRTPATSANLGPGFDALGLALALYDEVTAEVTRSGCQVRVTGAGAGKLPGDERHLVVRAMRATFDLLGGQPPGLALHCVNRIPQARGLGSSAAAVVAGVRLARALVSDGSELLDEAGVLRLAAELEGHPDNVAPCLLGGFTIAWVGSDPIAGSARAVRLMPERSVVPTVLIPAERGLTAQARAALPADVPHRDAAWNTGRAALLVHALTADPALLFVATGDRLHQPYRAAGMPGTASMLARLRAAGVAAVVSGAGPALLALSGLPTDFDPGIGWEITRLAIDTRGAQVIGGRLGHAEGDPVAAGRKS